MHLIIKTLLASGVIIGSAALITIATLPMDNSAQIITSITLIGVLSIVVSGVDNDNQHFARLLCIIIGLLISFRYLFWRAWYTLYASSTLDLMAVYLLFAAEVFSFLLFALSAFVNMRPLNRPRLSMREEPEATPRPSVDVMVPSYNESPRLLEVTLRAAKQMHYDGEVSVYLLDDGGTDQKINDKCPDRAAAAISRRRDLKVLAENTGCKYITRALNEDAKAGNINHALGITKGELITILDADHVPTVDFLDRTTPWLARYPDVFLVQTPHFMINSDPVERNLFGRFGRIPAENDMFYATIQRGLDFWSASFFCGSAAIIRRKHLEEVGGLAGQTITEDAETALKLHARGYCSVYLDNPLVSGLAPESFTGFMVQRMRWAQGMIQILLLERPFMCSGLKWYQRIGYMSSIGFWLFPLVRVIFITAPLAYLFLGLQVYNAGIKEIIAYTVPHIIASYMVSATLFGRHRWVLISEIYESVQSLFSLVAITKVILKPRNPRFIVTPKSENQDNKSISSMSKPFYILLIVIAAGMFFGIWRMIEYPFSRESTAVVLFWNTFNFIIILASLGVLLEQPQRRSSPRVPVRETGELLLNNAQIVPVEVKDLSATGVGLKVSDQSTHIEVNETAVLRVEAHALSRHVELPVTIKTAEGKSIGVAFNLTDPRDANNAVAYVFGDSSRWQFVQYRKFRKMSFIKFITWLFVKVFRTASSHVGMAAANVWKRRRI